MCCVVIFEEIKSVNFKLESELNAAKGKAKRVGRLQYPR